MHESWGLHPILVAELVGYRLLLRLNTRATSLPVRYLAQVAGCHLTAPIPARISCWHACCVLVLGASIRRLLIAYPHPTKAKGMLIRGSPPHDPVPSTGRVKRVAAKFHLSPGKPMFSIAELDSRQIGLAPMPEGRQT